MVPVIWEMPWTLPDECTARHKQLLSVEMCHVQLVDHAAPILSQELENPIYSLEQNQNKTADAFVILVNVFRTIAICFLFNNKCLLKTHKNEGCCQCSTLLVFSFQHVILCMLVYECVCVCMCLCMFKGNCCTEYQPRPAHLLCVVFFQSCAEQINNDDDDDENNHKNLLPHMICCTKDELFDIAVPLLTLS